MGSNVLIKAHEKAGQKVDLVHLGAYNFDFKCDAVWNGKAQVYELLGFRYKLLSLA